MLALGVQRAQWEAAIDAAYCRNDLNIDIKRRDDGRAQITLRLGVATEASIALWDSIRCGADVVYLDCAAAEWFELVAWGPFKGSK